MAGIVIKNFSGMRPVVNKKNLAPNEAEEAKDTRLFSGAIEPIKENTTVTPLKISSGSATTIFRGQDTGDEANNWLEFSEDVDLALSPITQDQFKRIYWTGQGVPKMATTSDAFATGTTQYPRNSLNLGIPKPSNAPVATGTAVIEYTLTPREYAFAEQLGSSSTSTYKGSAYESALIEIDPIETLTDVVDAGNLHPSSFSADTSSLFKINFEVAHNLEAGDYIVFSNSTEAGWNNQWEVGEVISQKSIKIKNTYTFPSNNPSGDYELKRRYLPTVKLRGFRRRTNEEHENIVIFRKKDGNYRRIAEIDPDEIREYEDDLTDAQLPASTNADKKTENRPTAPQSPPTVVFTTEDDTSERLNDKTITVKKVTGTGSGAIFTTSVSHGLNVGDTFQFNSGGNTFSGSQEPVQTIQSTTEFTSDGSWTVPSAPFNIKRTTSNISQKVFAYTFSSSIILGSVVPESARSKSSTTIKGYSGTEVRIIMSEDPPKTATKKKIYSCTLDGSNEIQDGSWVKIAEVPVSTKEYIYKFSDSNLSFGGGDGAGDSNQLSNKRLETESIIGGFSVLPPRFVAETRNYVYTYVSAYGEEGQPSEPSVAIDIDPYSPVTVTMDTAPTGDYNITKKFLYRTSTGSGDTNFQFVREVSVGTTSTIDIKQQTELGELIPSTNYEPPPSDMRGLRVMANGIFVGFSNKDVCFSEPFQPHAWSSQNFITVDHDIVGLGAFGQSVAILTKSFPYIATGIDPNAMSLAKTSIQQACVSKRSIVETGNSVIFASPDGLVSLGLSGVSVITARIISQEQWQSYNPSSIHSYLHEGRYYAFYNNGSTSGLIIFSLNGQDAPLILGTQYSSAGRVVPLEDSLYIVDSGDIVKMDKSATTKSYSWKSKSFEFPKPTNFSTAQVIADSYPSAGITLKVFADGTAKETVAVTNSDPFRISGGYLASDWQMQVEGSATITSIHLSQSLEELSAK
tara:strand:+ start:1082 stop:3979 length:2898 start_codon:yes stop_codon:yes gene_type:complete